MSYELTMNNSPKNEIIKFMIASQRKKYVGINLGKYVQILYIKNTTIVEIIFERPK